MSPKISCVIYLYFYSHEFNFLTGAGVDAAATAAADEYRAHTETTKGTCSHQHIRRTEFVSDASTRARAKRTPSKSDDTLAKTNVELFTIFHETFLLHA